MDFKYHEVISKASLQGDSINADGGLQLDCSMQKEPEH